MAANQNLASPWGIVSLTKATWPYVHPVGTFNPADDHAPRPESRVDVQDKASRDFWVVERSAVSSAHLQVQSESLEFDQLFLAVD